MKGKEGRKEGRVSTVWVVGVEQPKGARGVTGDIWYPKSCNMAPTNKVRNISLNSPATLAGVLAASPPPHG